MDKEQIQTEIKQLQERLNILSNELEKCENQSTLSIRKPQLKERYYVIGYTGVDTFINTNDDWEEKIIEDGNYWFTKEQAEFEANREKFTRLFKKYVKEHSEPMDCTDIKLDRFYAYWDMEDKLIRIISHKGYIVGFQIYGSSKEVIEDAIKFVGEYNFKKYILQVKCEEDNIISNIDKPRREGNYIYFGSYPQSDSKTKEPIKWQILEENNGELLLLTDKIIDCKEYNDELDNNYETSDIRKWLNNNFYKTAFNTDEQSMIVTSNIVTNRYDGGKLTTNDKVFLLSEEEAKKYIKNYTARKKQGTKYAEDNGLYVADNGNSWWWLRSPSSVNSKSDGYVSTDGGITDCYVDDTDTGVAAALRIKLATN